jgi:uncharacterized protein DUF6881
MRYSRLLWSHSFLKEPVEVYSEHDESGWERRKVEVFRDGSLGFASQTDTAGGTKLSLIPCPPDEEVTSDAQFKVSEISEEEFERIWNGARISALVKG